MTHAFFQEVTRHLPYQTQRRVCTENELWTHVSTVPQYQWTTFVPTVPVFVVPSFPFVIRDGLEEPSPSPCSGVNATNVTEEDMQRCELVCKAVKVRECGKVLQLGEDGEGGHEEEEEEEEVWVDDEDTCVELEKTQCTVQGRHSVLL